MPPNATNGITLLRTDHHQPARKPAAVRLWIIGLVIGVLGGAMVALALTEVAMVKVENQAES